MRQLDLLIVGLERLQIPFNQCAIRGSVGIVLTPQAVRRPTVAHIPQTTYTVEWKSVQALAEDTS